MNWQECYESGDTPWDKGVPAPSISQLKSQLPHLFSSGKKVLSPGSGRGIDAAAIAKAGPEVTAVDLAPLAIEQGKKHLPSDLPVTFLEADVFDLPPHLHNHFDIIWEHTFFCAIDPSQRPKYAETMASLLKPDGRIAGIFFTNPDVPLEEGPPFKASMDEIISVLGTHFALEWEATPTDFFEDRENREHLMLFRKLHACAP